VAAAVLLDLDLPREVSSENNEIHFSPPESVHRQLLCVPCLPAGAGPPGRRRTRWHRASTTAPRTTSTSASGTFPRHRA